MNSCVLKKVKYFIIYFLCWIVFQSTDCNRDSFEDKAYLVSTLFKLSTLNDTLKVGDTLIVYAVLPDSLDVINLLTGDTTKQKINILKKSTSTCNLNLIDKELIKAISLDFSFPELRIQTKGMNGEFSKSYPFEVELKYILNKPGNYFLFSGYDNLLDINGVSDVAFKGDFDVNSKNFEILAPLGFEFQNHAQIVDEENIVSYFPFVVIE